MGTPPPTRPPLDRGWSIMMDVQILRGLWLTIMILIALLVAVGTGALTRTSGAHAAKSVIAAGASFAGTLLLLFAIWSFLVGLQP